MVKKLKLLFLFFTALAIVSIPLLSQSQGNGAIQGKVTTPEGEALPGVEVSVTSPNLIGGIQSAITNANGRFRFVALPPGTYVVEAKIMGFNPQKRSDIRLSVAVTLTVDFALEVGTLEESVEVIGVAPTIDVKDSQTATTEMSNEFLQQIPSGRSMRGQLKFAPGVHSESTFGSSESLANNFMIDGVKVNSPEAGEAEVHIDFDSIEEMKVMGVGAPAEYGGFSGAVVNTVTKSGGNDFEGLFTFYLQRPGWHSRNSDDPELIEKEFNEEYDLHFNLGGPVIKDKLWFFTSGKYNYDHRHIEDYDGPTEYRKEGRINAKFTWQPSANNRLAAMLEWNKDAVYNIEAGPFTAPEAVPSEGARQYYFNVSFLHIFSDTTFLEAKLGGYDQAGQIDLQSDNPPHFDLATEYLSGNFWEYWEFPRRRIQLNTSVSHHAEEFLGGSHDFKFGVEYERSPLSNVRGYPGGALYLDYMGEPYIRVVYDGYSAEPTTQRISAFVQDSWTIGERLTINPGLRINSWRGYLPSSDDAVFAPKMGIAPRLGITFDVFGDHTTALKAHYGKYYHGVMGMFYLHLEPQGTYSEYFYEDGAWELDFSDPWENEYTMDPDLRMAYMNQYVIGIEREIVRDVSVGMSLIRRTNHDFIDKVNLTGEWEPTSYTSPLTGETYNVYERLNPGDNQFYITNPEVGKDYGQAFSDIVMLEPTRRYTGLEFTFDKRYSNNWQLHISYVYSKATGTDDNTWGEFGENRTSSLGSSTKYSNPNYQINADGRLGIDPTHMLKISGSYNIPVVDVSLGFYYSYITGNPYSKNLWLDDEIDPDPVSWGDAVYFYAEEKNTYRLPAQHNLDLRLEKFFKFDRFRIGALIDLFNALNSDTVTSRESEINPWSDFQFGYVWRIRNPRTFRLGFRFEF